MEGEQPLSDFARQVARAIAVSHHGITVAKVNGPVAAVLLARGYIARFDKHGTPIGPATPPGSERDDVWRTTQAGQTEFGGDA